MFLLTLQGVSPPAHPRRCGVPRDAISAAEMGELLPRYVTTDAPGGPPSAHPRRCGVPRDAISVA
ncbi:MAG TPA: hypothetical protein PKL40_07395 [Methanoregulaceae archaeon]|nr:hypothetical protein [Methanoregulaceae archaeon]